MCSHEKKKLFAILAIIAVIPLAVFAQQSNEPRFVLTDRDALVIMEEFGAEMVAPPKVIHAEWSPSGKYVLAARDYVKFPLSGTFLQLPPPPDLSIPGEISLVLWNSSTRRSLEVWKKAYTAPGEKGTIEQIGWLPGREEAIAVVRLDMAPSESNPTGRDRLFLRVDVSRRQAQPVTHLKDGDQVFLCPVLPMVVLLDREAQTAQIMRSNGSIGQPIPLSQEGSVALNGQWSQEGRRLSFQAGEKWYGLDVRSGEIQAVELPFKAYEPRPPSLPVKLQQTRSTWKEGESSYPLSLLWLESVSQRERSRALISAEGEGGKLSPDGNAVLYISQGAAFVKPFIRVDKQQMVQARDQAKEAVALSNAKQIGLALMMYAKDYDDTFPPSDASIKDLLMPYVKNENVFYTPGSNADGFTYVYGGGPISAIQQPAETILGYFQGPGGRAVIYADGHVTWEGQ